MKVYSIKDIKSELFGQPFYSRNDASAARSVQMFLGSGKDDPMIQYPEDFVLYRVAEWDESTGVMKPEVSPYSVASLTSLKVTSDR